MSEYDAPKKSLGQHWLNDEDSLNQIIEFSGIKKGDVVLEVGPGQGSLTDKLLEAGAKVIAVELDEILADRLISRNLDNLKVHIKSILEFDLGELPADYKVVANIPYYLTSKLIRNLSESTNSPISSTLLIQKEVAERVCARPGNMSLLSVSAQVYNECELGPVITANKFTPPPKVDSRLVKLERRPQSLISNVDDKLFFRVVKAGFASRRKTLANSISAGMNMPKSLAEKKLKEAGVEPSSRAQELSIDEWLKLCSLII